MDAKENSTIQNIRYLNFNFMGNDGRVFCDGPAIDNLGFGIGDKIFPNKGLIHKDTLFWQMDAHLQYDNRLAVIFPAKTGVQERPYHRESGFLGLFPTFAGEKCIPLVPTRGIYGLCPSFCVFHLVVSFYRTMQSCGGGLLFLNNPSNHRSQGHYQIWVNYYWE